MNVGKRFQTTGMCVSVCLSAVSVYGVSPLVDDFYTISLNTLSL